MRRAHWMSIVGVAAAALAFAAGLPGCKKRPPPPAAEEGLAAGPRRIRPMRKAGTWYAREPEPLGAELDRYLVAASLPAFRGRLVGLVSPHAGYRFSGPTAAYGFKALGRARGVKRVILLGVSHHRAFRGLSLPEATHYETPFGPLPIDGAMDRLRGKPGFVSEPAAHADEHSLELQAPFLKRVRPKVRIVPMLVGRVDDELVGQAAEALAPLLGTDTVILASSDFTHRGGHFRYEVPRREGEPLREAVKRLDFGTLPFIAALDARGLRRYYHETRITMCGREPVAVMLATLKRAGIAVESQVLHYTTSGDVVGDWRSTVSYFSVALTAAASGGAP